MHSIKASEQFANTYPGESASPTWGNKRNYERISEERGFILGKEKQYNTMG